MAFTNYKLPMSCPSPPPSGHVIYEMVVGKELSRLIPADVDLINVESDGCLEILEYIFDRREDGRFKRGIIKVKF